MLSFRLSPTLARRLGMTRGLWHLVRFQSRLCRWSPIDPRSLVGAVEEPRWLGNTRIGGRSRHALFAPSGSRVVFRFWAPKGSRFVAWCGVLPGESNRLPRAEFKIAIRADGAPDETTASLTLDPVRTPRDRRWRRLVVDLRNETPKNVEVTLTTHVPDGVTGDVSAVWGEPRLDWRRPAGEIGRLVRDVSHDIRRGRMLAAARTVHGRLSATSHPSMYQIWLSQHAPTQEHLNAMRMQAASLPYRPLVSVVTPVYNTDPRWLRACIDSVRRQAYPEWQLCLADDGSTKPGTREVLRELAGDPRIKVHFLAKNAGIAAASNAALALADGEFVAFLDHDDEIPPEALFEVVSYLNQHPDTDFIYSDEDKLEPDGTRSGVYFKPDWSPEHFLTNMYTCHLMVVRRSLLQQIGGFREGYEGAQDYDLVLRLMERTPRIHHLPKVLYHWRRIPESTAGSATAKPWANDAGRLALQDYVQRNHLDAQILPGDYTYLYRVRFAIRGQPLISVVVPALPDATDEGAVGACLRTLRTLADQTNYRHFEVLVVTGDARTDADVAKLLRSLPHREIRVGRSSSPDPVGQRILAARQAGGDHLLMMDWGLTALDRDWLTALLEYSQQPAIGAVGAKLLYPDGSLKHIGLVLGVNGVAAPAFHRHPQSTLGYWGTAIATRNYSAVSGTCMLTRRQLFEQVGGFRDAAGYFFDVDYCLRATAAGCRVVFTPYAPLVHTEWCRPAGTVIQEQAIRLRAEWGDRIARDPYYNPNFSRDTPDYEPELSVIASNGIT